MCGGCCGRGEQRGVFLVDGVEFVEGFVVCFCPGFDFGEGCEFGEDRVRGW